MKGDDMTQLRESDHPSAQQVITIDRKIPLPWLLTGAGILALTLGTMYFDQRRSGEKIAEVASDVKAIREDVQRQGIKAVEDTYQLRDLSRRLTVLEAAVQAQQSAGAVGKGK